MESLESRIESKSLIYFLKKSKKLEIRFFLIFKNWDFKKKNWKCLNNCDTIRKNHLIGSAFSAFRKQKQIPPRKTQISLKMTSGTFTASEVARLVCGYLQTTGCDETKQRFVEESAPDLKLGDFANLVSQGILRTFDVDGRSLSDILNEYSA